MVRLRKETDGDAKNLFVNSFGMPTIYGVRIEQRPGIFRRIWSWIKKQVAALR